MASSLYLFLGRRFSLPRLPEGFDAAVWRGRWMSRTRCLRGRAFAKLPTGRNLPEGRFEAEVLALATCFFGRIGVGIPMPLRISVINERGGLSHDEFAAAVPVGR